MDGAFKMKWFNQFGLDRAAKAYAKRLPAEMNAGWGSSEVYTIGQVKAAIRHLGLKGRYIAIAYAAFLTKEDFTEVAFSGEAAPGSLINGVVSNHDQRRAILAEWAYD